MELNCKVKQSNYSFEYLSKKANELGFNKDGKSCYFLADNFYENIFNPVLIFDIEKHEWNFSLLKN